eukprot:365625-Chlamydomonas_euryale.AAC.13
MLSPQLTKCYPPASIRALTSAHKVRTRPPPSVLSPQLTKCVAPTPPNPVLSTRHPTLITQRSSRRAHPVEPSIRVSTLPRIQSSPASVCPHCPASSQAQHPCVLTAPHPVEPSIRVSKLPRIRVSIHTRRKDTMGWNVGFRVRSGSVRPRAHAQAKTLVRVPTARTHPSWTLAHIPTARTHPSWTVARIPTTRTRPSWTLARIPTARTRPSWTLARVPTA